MDATTARSLKGFDEVELVPGCTYRDCSTVVVCPTRGKIDHRVVSAWEQLMKLPNQKRHMMIVAGDEVGQAYNRAIEKILGDHNLSRYRYVMTMEDDNIPPFDAHIRLLNSIGDYDAVGGLYFQKRAPNSALLLGDPEHFARTGEMEFRPRDPREHIEAGAVVEVNCMPMGCSLYRMDLFREIPAPWFQTIAFGVQTPLGVMGRQLQTQDASFSERARWMGKRFAIDCSVRVGHIDFETDEVW